MDVASTVTVFAYMASVIKARWARLRYWDGRRTGVRRLHLGGAMVRSLLSLVVAYRFRYAWTVTGQCLLVELALYLDQLAHVWSEVLSRLAGRCSSPSSQPRFALRRSGRCQSDWLVIRAKWRRDAARTAQLHVGERRGAAGRVVDRVSLRDCRKCRRCKSEP